MVFKEMNLKPAHSGYYYQDIVTAYFLISTLIGRWDSVTVDKKQVEDDRIDDLEASISGRIHRIQIKSSQVASRSITRSDFTNKTSTLRIDRLVLTHKRSSVAVEEYRLCATWQPPRKSNELSKVIEPVDCEPTFPGTDVVFYKFKPDSIWPLDSGPVWPVLEKYMQPSAEFGRDDFVEFCSKFFIELNLPIASKDLLSPGLLEKTALHLLDEYVGIGRYPNVGRQSRDVAALAISLAYLARTEGKTLNPADVVAELRIKTDYGRVSQSFPLDEKYFYDRPEFRTSIRAKLDDCPIHIITAPPGAGKSWELTKMVEELASDYLVARHYCYLEPGDELIERRVTTDVFFANIIAELRDADPKLGTSSPRLAADLATLEELMKEAVQLGKKVVIIIDGLDHIARVRSSSNTLSDDETDIIEKLATLTIPNGVTLILGSQPGEHLTPLLDRKKDVLRHKLPAWDDVDVIQLARLYAVDRALQSFGIHDPDEIANVLGRLADKSSGNPLYARYLCKGLIAAIKSGAASDPEYWLLSSPKIKDDIAEYYRHLYDNRLREAQTIAELFGVIDFSVTEAELKEILPSLLLSRLPDAIKVLSPVLIEVSGQGGMRIFHESFRRFILDELDEQKDGLENVLSPVIDWLKERGFYRDAKSYRFLLPALRRARQDEDIIDLVGVKFVSESVSNGHPVEAIQRNLAIAAEVAGRTKDWPALVRCVELRRSLSVCFEDDPSLQKTFWSRYAEIFGVKALAERLLFDGKPTLSREEGLHACLSVDDQGEVAPWQEYFSLPTDDDESYVEPDFDYARCLTDEDSLNLAIIQGRLRLGKGWRLLRYFRQYLSKSSSKPRVCFVRKISMRFSRMDCVDVMTKLATRFEKGDGAPLGLAIKLGVADFHYGKGDRESAAIIAQEALKIASTPPLAVMCVELGAIPEHPSSYAAGLSSFVVDIDPKQEQLKIANVREWISSIKLVSLAKNGDEIIEREEARVQGEGWYRCWLRYVLALSKAQARHRLGLPFDIKSVFSILAEDVDPFVGEPGAGGLHRLRNVIKETLASGLALVATESEWDYVIDTIIHVGRKTGIQIDREDGGPVSVGTVIKLLLPYARSKVVGEKICSVIEGQIRDLDSTGTYYSTHAKYVMQLATVQMALNKTSEAEENWQKVGVYLAGYGWHKDTTLLDLIGSVSALHNASKEKALKALEDLQPLVGAVLCHTDRRETRHAPNVWFSKLLSADPPSALNALARTVLEHECIENWEMVNALESVANYACDKANPMLVDALWATILFKIEGEGEGRDVAQKRLKPIRLLHQKNQSMATDRLYQLAAEAANDATNYNYNAVEEIKKFALEHNLEIKCKVEPPSEDRLEYSIDQKKDNSSKVSHATKNRFFPKDASFVEIITGLRSLSYSEDEGKFRDASLDLSDKLKEMQQAGNEASARRILHFFAREVVVPLSSGLHPLANLAQYLKKAGCDSLATIAYSLAYTHSRGGGGWYAFGDASHRDALHQAIALNAELAKQTVANDVSYRLRNIGYGGGISKGLIECIVEWRDHEVVIASWNEAYKVISHRLPLASCLSPFARFDSNELSNWSIDEGVVALLLARLSEPRATRKIASLSGILKAIKYCPDSVARPLGWWLCRDTPATSLLLVLQLLFIAEDEPYPITNKLKELLTRYSQSAIWGAALFSSALLERARIEVAAATHVLRDLNSYPRPSDEGIEQVMNDEELSLLMQTQPKIALHLAIYNSRVPRPAWGDPSKLTTATTDLVRVSDDPRFEGWLRLGLVEKQYIGGDRIFSPPTECVHVLSGAAVAPTGSSCPTDYFPFGEGDCSDWWNREIPEIHQGSTDRWTPLLALTRHKDLLGNDLVFILPKELLELIEIQPSEFSERLIWTDNKGKPLLASRYWRVKGEWLDAEPDLLRGADFIVRPDVVEKLENLFASPIKFYRQVSKSKISNNK